MGWYLREVGGRSLAGAFGAVIALLSWVYIEAQIVLGGVQVTKAVFPIDAAAVGDTAERATGDDGSW